MAIGKFPRITGDVVFDVASVKDGQIVTNTITVGDSGYAVGTGNATTSDGAGTGATLDITTITDGEAASITLTDDGSGYSAGTEAVTGGTGTGATIDITVKNGAAQTTTLTAGGDGYTTGTGVATVTGGTGDNSLTVDITAEDTITGLAIAAAGTGYPNGPITGAATVYAGSGTGLTVDYTAIGGVVQATPTINNSGSGYTNAEVVDIIGGNMDCSLTLTVTSGVIQSVTLNNTGETNTAADIITISTGSANSTFTVDTVSDGAIKTVALNAKGADYTVADVLTVANGTGGTVNIASVTDGIVTGIVVNNAGSGYVGGDTETLTITGGGGSAALTVTTILDGEVLTVTVTDGGTGYEVGDVLDAGDITNDGGGDDAAQFTVATETVAGSGIIATLTTTVGGEDYDVADTLTHTGSSEGGVSDSTMYVDHYEYEQGGNVQEYVNGSGLDLTVDTDSDGIVTAVNTIVAGGTNYQTGTLVRVVEDDKTSCATFVISTVSTGGVVTALTLLDGGFGYTASQTALDTVETQQQLKSDSPEVLWIGTLTGSFNPATAPSTSSTDNDPRTKVVRKADLEQLIVQKKMIDGGTVTVYAEPTIINADGIEVGNTVRAEDCTDKSRCEANGFYWTEGTTGDADAGSYGHCIELPGSFTGADQTACDAEYGVGLYTHDVSTTCEKIAASDAECPVGYQETGGLCVKYTHTEVNALSEATYGLEGKMRECEASGNWWNNTNQTCIDSGTPGNFSLGTYTFANTSGANRKYVTGSTQVDYLRNACTQLGYHWNNSYVCEAKDSDPAGNFTTQVTCVAAGYIWIAGSCYSPSDFGDGQSRNTTAQDDSLKSPR